MTILKNWFSLKDCDRKEKIKCIVMYIMIAILVLVDVFMCFTFAKYVTSSSPAGDSARVAKFDVSITGKEGVALADSDLVMNLGDGLDPTHYDFKVENNSEVAVEYTLILTMDSKYDESLLAITAAEDGGTPVNHGTATIFKDPTTNKNKYRYTFSNVGTIAPGGSSNGQLVFNYVPEEDIGVNSAISNMNLEIVVNQID